MQLSKENIREKEFHNNLQSQKKGRFEDIFYKELLDAIKHFDASEHYALSSKFVIMFIAVLVEISEIKFYLKYIDRCDQKFCSQPLYLLTP